MKVLKGVKGRGASSRDNRFKKMEALIAEFETLVNLPHGPQGEDTEIELELRFRRPWLPGREDNGILSDTFRELKAFMDTTTAYTVQAEKSLDQQIDQSPWRVTVVGDRTFTVSKTKQTLESSYPMLEQLGIKVGLAKETRIRNVDTNNLTVQT